jgi:hypothetical protein
MEGKVRKVKYSIVVPYKSISKQYLSILQGYLGYLDKTVALELWIYVRSVLDVCPWLKRELFVF